MMKISYIGLGSNLDNPVMQIHAAIDRLDALPNVTVKKSSHLYSSKPMGPQDQPDFVNAVVEIETDLTAHQLLSCLQRIETAQKRVRSEMRWGPRTIDLDILLFGNEVVNTHALQIPHPGLSQRAFVVYPIGEIAPNLVLPSGETITNLKANCPLQGLHILPATKSENI